MSILRLLPLALCALLLSGCTAVTTFRGIPLAGDGLYVSGLPPLRQDGRYSCGPTCLAAVAATLGVRPADFKARCPVSPPDATGGDLRSMAESLGLRAFVFEGSLADLQENLRQGRPLIVMIPKPPDPALRQAGLVGALGLAISEHVSHPAHWVVVIGLSSGNQDVIIHDPAAGLLQIRTVVFLQWWRRMNNLAVLVVPS